jgi:CDP-paratose 2-epimerase
MGPVLITGGAGFIGTNLAHRLMREGSPVTILDNLSRPGVERNLRWLQDAHGDLLRVEIGDVRNRAAVARSVRSARHVVHLAAQVAVTASLTDPLHDFEVNALGTLNLLNVLAHLGDAPPLLFTSTNKVYGALDDIDLTSDGRRYRPTDERIRESGIDETRPLDFRSPYGCSKGAADQYVLDFARSFGLPAVVFRMSCIYGPHQFGTEDQGWVAHFLLRALSHSPITLYGDGQQVRDVLFVEDLVAAMLTALDHIDTVRGMAFNIGGGIHHTTSLVEVIELIERLTGVRPALEVSRWRPGDQRYYVSDTSRFSAMTGWRQAVSLEDGMRALHDWLIRNGIRPPHRAVGWSDPAGIPAAAAGER